MEGTSEVTKPSSFLRWAGSKRQLLPHLRTRWSSEFKRYVEPFAGSSCLFFELAPDRALLGDKNSELIEVYSILCETPKELHERVTSFPRSKESYYRLRSIQPSSLTAIDRAARFIYLNRYCFNGLYRTNLQGHFNVPFAPAKTGQIPSVEQFVACSHLLKKAELRCWDFGTTMRFVSSGDFAYVDPPFAVESRRVFVEYGPKTFTKADLSRLAAHLRRADERGAVFLVSYAECAEARKLFDGWRINRVRVRRNIAGFAASRRSAYELLVSNR